MITRIQYLAATALCAAILAVMSGDGSAAPIAAASARPDAAAPGITLAQHRNRNRGRFIDDNARQRWIDRRWKNMKVQEDDEGFIYLPGINTDRRGITTLSGPPRTLQQPRRFGERPSNMQRRFGEPPPGGWQRQRLH
jgi:hypothetical protein